MHPAVRDGLQSKHAQIRLQLWLGEGRTFSSISPTEMLWLVPKLSTVFTMVAEALWEGGMGGTALGLEEGVDGGPAVCNCNDVARVLHARYVGA